jgi:hypothetical protein
MGSETIAFDIFLVILCLNGGLLLVESAFDTPLITPFDGTAVSGITTGAPAEIYNATTGTGITQNLTSGDAENATIGGSAATLNPVETLFFPIALLWTFIQFFTGGFIFQVVALFGFPPMFVFALQGIIGALLARAVIYWVWGR